MANMVWKKGKKNTKTREIQKNQVSRLAVCTEKVRVEFASLVESLENKHNSTHLA